MYLEDHLIKFEMCQVTKLSLVHFYIINFEYACLIYKCRRLGCVSFKQTLNNENNKKL